MPGARDCSVNERCMALKSVYSCGPIREFHKEHNDTAERMDNTGQGESRRCRGNDAEKNLISSSSIFTVFGVHKRPAKPRHSYLW